MAFAGRTNCSRRGGLVNELFRQKSYKGHNGEVFEVFEDRKKSKMNFLGKDTHEFNDERNETTFST